MFRRVAIQTLGAMLGIGLLAYLIRRAGPSTLMESLHRLGWGLALIIALGGVAHLVKAYAWRQTLKGCNSKVSLARLFQLRLVSEGAGQIGALGQLCGDACALPTVKALTGSSSI